MRRVVITVVAVIAAGALVVGGIVVWSIANRRPLPMSDQCSATAGGSTTLVSPEQASNAAIIAGVSVQRGLVPRAASIALATAYQESGIRNLEYGHSDSLGLFQQRPSQGWGTKEQITDPWYSSGKFYQALVKVKNWKTADINDVAQKVQRSAYPEAYRKHEKNARTLASSLAGETPASFTCTFRSIRSADPAGLADFLAKTFGKKLAIESSGPGPSQTLTLTAGTPAAAWSAAHTAVATAKQFGVATITAGAYSWTYTPWSPSWQGTGPTDTTQVTIAFSPA